MVAFVLNPASRGLLSACVLFFFWPYSSMWDQPALKSIPPTLVTQGLNHWTTREVPSLCLLKDIRAELFSKNVCVCAHAGTYMSMCVCGVSMCVYMMDVEYMCVGIWYMRVCDEYMNVCRCVCLCVSVHTVCVGVCYVCVCMYIQCVCVGVWYMWYVCDE